MTSPREQRAAGTAATALTEPEAIEDLDVTGDEADAVGGGLNVGGVAGESKGNSPGPIPIPYPL